MTSRTTLALLGSALLAGASAGARAAEPGPAMRAVLEPAPGRIVRDVVPGGWVLQIAGDPEHVLAEVPGYSAASGRALVVAAVTSKDFSKLEATTATILGPDGKTLRQESLHGYRATAADLSPNGKLAAIVAEPWEEGGNRAVLIGFAEGGKIWKRPADVGDVVIAGDRWIAEIAPPEVLGAEDDMANNPPSPAAGTAKPKAARFFDAAGDAIDAPPPLQGAVTRAGAGLAAVFDHALHVYDADLSPIAKVRLPFADGIPAASADGSVIAVSDESAETRDADRQVLLFDRHGKPLGALTLPAAAGLEAALSPEGSAVLSTPASLGEESPKEVVEASDTIVVTLADRTGRAKWRYARARRTPTEHAGSLSVAANGRRAACAFFANDPDSHPDRIDVFDENGKILYEAEGEFRAAWLDPSGEWLFTIEGNGLSKLKVKSLVEKTAFPK